MNSHTFIKKYLKSHHAYSANNFLKAFLILGIGFAIAWIFAYLHPIKWFQEKKQKAWIAQTEKAIDISYYKDIAKNTKTYPIPIRNATIINGYGKSSTTSAYHTGIDIVEEHHAPVRSITGGQVTFVGTDATYGNCVEIRHEVDNNKTIYSFYAHLSKVYVSIDEVVLANSVIGLEGGDPQSDPFPGNSTAHHLHFEIRNASGSGNTIDPNPWIHL